VSGAGIMIGMSTPEDPSLTALRAAYEAERAALQALEIEIAAMAERNRRLDHLVKELPQALYGRKSEKLTADERQLTFEDVETAVAEMETAPAGASP
jgi:transposase